MAIRFLIWMIVVSLGPFPPNHEGHPAAIPLRILPGADQSGWWFGPEIGGEKARSEDHSAEVSRKCGYPQSIRFQMIFHFKMIYHPFWGVPFVETALNSPFGLRDHRVREIA